MSQLLLRYERPELFDVGSAVALTLGRCGHPCDDACKCTLPCGDGAEECEEIEIQL